ncbi:MAG: HIRAN domain-containing protein [Armatimonadetes bacterium]|nr:HIRAN domain-containing protein [Armatimonadota bacterium]
MDGIDGIEKGLAPADFLLLRREPQNPHDGLAILILDPTGRKIGYIPRVKNEVLARLMDAGKLVFGRLESKVWLHGWLRLAIRIYMRDP